MKKVYEKIDYKKICKRCHQIHRYELIQTGSTEDFVSKKCPVCDALHKKDGELYIEKIRGKDVMINCCPKCKNKDIIKNPYTNEIWCDKCSEWLRA